MPYAVAQFGIAIYGIGDTAEAAIADALEYTDGLELPDDGLLKRAGTIGDLIVAPCTEALVAKFQQIGSDIAHDQRKNGTLCLPEEN